MKIEWNRATPFSKILAGILFIVFPFVGFYLGIKYGEIKSSARIIFTNIEYNNSTNQDNIYSCKKSDNINISNEYFLIPQDPSEFMPGLTWSPTNADSIWGKNAISSQSSAFNDINVCGREWAANIKIDTDEELLALRSKFSENMDKWFKSRGWVFSTNYMGKEIYGNAGQNSGGYIKLKDNLIRGVVLEEWGETIDLDSDHCPCTEHFIFFASDIISIDEFFK